MDQFFLDANVIVRFLANDDDVQSPLAFKIFQKAINEEITLHLTTEVITECCWVLHSKRYNHTKEDIANKLSVMIRSNGIKTANKETVLRALTLYHQGNVDFVDAYLSASAKDSNIGVLTWNTKDFKRLNAEFYKPEEVLNT